MDQNLNEGASAPADDTFIADLLAESEAGRQPEQQRQEPEAPRAQPEPQPTREHERIPLAEYLSEREKRQQFERRVQELEAAQKKPEAVPEIWSNPDQWADHRVRSAVDPMQQQMLEDRMFYSRRFAVQEHGDDAVKNAMQAAEEMAQQNPSWGQQAFEALKKSRDPFGELMSWHKSQSTMKEIGPDPAAYRAKILDEARNDPEFLASLGLTQAPAPAQPRSDNGQFQPAPKAPARAQLPSMRAAGSAAAVTTRPSADQSGEDLLDDILSGT